MSLFNMEEKITLNTWDDIIHRPRYESPTEPRQYLYGHVLTVYSIDDPDVLCRVSDCRWADNLKEQFARVEQLVKEGQAFFDPKNMERLKSIPLLESGPRRVRS